MPLHLKTGDGDLPPITEPVLLTRCACISHEKYRPALLSFPFHTKLCCTEMHDGMFLTSLVWSLWTSPSRTLGIVLVSLGLIFNYDLTYEFCDNIRKTVWNSLRLIPDRNMPMTECVWPVIWWLPNPWVKEKAGLAAQIWVCHTGPRGCRIQQAELRMLWVQCTFSLFFFVLVNWYLVDGAKPVSLSESHTYAYTLIHLLQADLISYTQFPVERTPDTHTHTYTWNPPSPSQYVLCPSCLLSHFCNICVYSSILIKSNKREHLFVCS